MKEMIFSLALIAVLSAVVDSVMREGEIKRTVRFAVGIVTALVIMFPLSSAVKEIKSGRFSYGQFAVEGEEYEKSRAELEEKCKDTEEYLEAMGVDAEINAYDFCGEIAFLTVKVNKGSKESAKKVVCSIFSVSENKVSVYG